MNINRYLTKLIASLVLILSYFLLPKYGFVSFDGNVCMEEIITHLLYPLSHANVWHLAANIMCLWMVTCKIRIAPAYIIAVACSFIPSVSLFDCIINWCIEGTREPTMGFSGVLFAVVGMSWGKVSKFKTMLWQNKWYLVIPAFLPHINFLIHFYCLMVGYVIGYILYSNTKLCVKRYVNL